tara:strand:+ start:772 stop:1191 length:420 start_codon:yes stop_codon:yes gene_type:complete
MSVYKPNSWGRTRRPKNSTKKDRDFITGSQSLTSLYNYRVGGTAEDSMAPSGGIYVTENQRYMHLHCSGSASGVDNVFVYMYASNSWSELVTGSAGSVIVGANEHKIVEIYGVDLVAFNTSSAAGPAITNKNYAAFSTF